MASRDLDRNESNFFATRRQLRLSPDIKPAEMADVNSLSAMQVSARRLLGFLTAKMCARVALMRNQNRKFKNE